MTEKITNESHNLPVNFSTFTSEEKQNVREQLYNFSEEPHFDDYERLNNYHILNYVTDVPDHGKKGDEYKNHFKWDIEGLREVCEHEKMNFEKVHSLFNPEKELTYTEIEKSFDGDIDLILRTMTLLTNNYSNAILKRKEDLFYDQIDSDDYIKFSPRLLINLSEERLFFTGKRLLDEFNKDSKYPYLENLNKKINGVIITFNQGLIIDEVKKYPKRIPFDDLRQEGVKGMLRAMETFNIDMNNRFSTYAKWWVDRFIKLYFIDNYSLIYHPRNLMHSVFNFKKEKGRLTIKLGRKLTFQEVVKECKRKNIKLPKNLEAIKLTLQQTVLDSLDKPKKPDSNQTLLDSLSQKDKEPDIDNPNPFYSNIIYFLAVNSDLTHLELQILEHNSKVPLNGNEFGRDKYTVKQVCELLKISPDKYYTIKKRAFNKIKSAADSYEIEIF